MTVPNIYVQTEVSGTGAPSHAEQVWLQADWRQIEMDVKRLQVRIAKATLKGRWGKVKALQRLLTRSYCSKMLAVKRVSEIEVKEHRGSTAKYGRHPPPNQREH